MINDKRSWFQPWWLTTRELAVWTVAIGVVCVWLVAARYQHEVAVEVRPAGVVVPLAGDVRTSNWRLDLNSATETELVMLPGIGPHRAQTILQERKKRGAFRSVWELCEVPGLTKALVQRLEPLLRAGPPAP